MAEKYQPPPEPPSGYNPDVQKVSSGFRGIFGSKSNNPFRNRQNQQQSNSYDQSPSYEPPPGPPPGRSDKKSRPEDEFAPPSGSSLSQSNEYAPPPGPPPSHKSNEPAPPPYDPWLAVPDNALLPPPPSFQEDTSPTANANYDDAARAHAWIRANPLWRARELPQEILVKVPHGDIRLTSPPGTKNATLTQRGYGTTHVRTIGKCQDSVFLSDVPVYAALSDSPLVTERTKIVYFEINVLSMGGTTGDAGIALGLVAPPYPSWRLPGWHRGSLGVHGDDGRRYVDDSFGGRDFTSAFQRGDIVGIGMTYSLPPGFSGGKPKCEVFFTRNGRREGGWDLHEEKDQQTAEGDVRGLEGEHDLLAAVGCFGGVEFEVKFRSDEWMFRPR